LTDLGPRLMVAPEGDPLELSAVFGRVAPVVLEIGSGMGEATAAMAEADRDRDYLAVEVHRPGVANLLALVDQAELTNVRVVEGDALDLLRQRIHGPQLAAVHIFFPDPWPKTRHHKRRLISPSTVALLRSRLRLGGTIHCATDHEGYAESMLDVLSVDPGLSNVYESYADRGARPITKFEQRAAGGVYELLFARTGVA
jgi:tRNA (guanine-N7-)-methyltransferase